MQVLILVRKKYEARIEFDVFLNSDLAQAGFEIDPSTLLTISQAGLVLRFSIFSWGKVSR